MNIIGNKLHCKTQFRHILNGIKNNISVISIKYDVEKSKNNNNKELIDEIDIELLER